MKRLRVLWCLIVALLCCWYSPSHVLCSEHGSPGPGVFIGDSSPPEHHHDHEPSHRTESKMEESRTQTHYSYDVGLESDTVALDEPHTHNTEQNVNPEEPVVVDVWPAPETLSDLETPAAIEPHSNTGTDPQTNRHTHTDPGPPQSSNPPRVDDLVLGQASAEPSQTHVQAPSDTPTDPSPDPVQAPNDTPTDPSPHPIQTPSDTPTDPSSDPIQTPSDTPTDPSSDPIQTPSDTPSDPSPDPIQTPRDTPTDPSTDPIQTPRDTPTDPSPDPIQTRSDTPTDPSTDPIQTPTNTPTDPSPDPIQTPSGTPTDPSTDPIQTPSGTPTDPSTDPIQTPTNTPTDPTSDPIQTPRDTPTDPSPDSIQTPSDTPTDPSPDSIQTPSDTPTDPSPDPIRTPSNTPTDPSTDPIQTPSNTPTDPSQALATEDPQHTPTSQLIAAPPASKDSKEMPDVQASPSSKEPDQNLGQPELDQRGENTDGHQDRGQDAQAEVQAGDSGHQETDPSVPSKEDIPTFDEWKKQVMEVEKEKTLSLHNSTSGSHLVKKVQKSFKNNYASVECGAKILSANNEAKSTSAILMENMDLYMLNPCSNKIWFVIELCEPIQVKQLDIANFELFSSTPKDFLVSISDRYPTNKWVKLGTFHARDERTVQSFPLDEQLYAKYIKMFIKYIKVELISHFGSEHFCPLSLIRVFGTSMVEEYEEIAESQYPSERLEYPEEDDDYPPGYMRSEEKGSKNLLGSATIAILNMVNNIAANVLGGKSEEGEPQMEANTSQSQNETEANKEVLLTPTPTTPPEDVDTVNLDLPAPQENPTVLHSTPTSPLLSPSEEIQIVTLVEDEEEEPPRSTVTLMEEEGDDDEPGEEEQWVRESQVYCPLPSSIPPLPPLSCVATLPELLRRWCNARLSRERQNGLRKRRKRAPADNPEDTPLPVPDHTQGAPQSTVTDTAPSPQNQDVPPTDLHDDTPPTDSPPLERIIMLEPSLTSAMPPDSSAHTSLSEPTPTQEEGPPASSLDEPAAPLKGAPVQETQEIQQASLQTLSPTTTPEPTASETASLDPPQPLLMEPPLLTASRPADIPPPTELLDPQPDTQTEPHTTFTEVENGDDQGEDQPKEPLRREESVEDLLLSIPETRNGLLHRSATDFYAELQSAGEYVGGNGGVNAAGSSQKESVFMRLNNRIKALEMNMSLSSRYLEELSQRYRKQMEEMQRAFNKTIIKLQNTSRIAEEQDQRQTESIQMLQGQLENVTKLMINITSSVSQLQREVSDRQSYLVVSLVLCLCLGLLLCLQCCKSSTTHTNTHTNTHSTANHYPSPKRCFSSYDDMSLKRRVACPLVRSKSFSFPTSEVGLDDLYIVEPLRFSPEKKKKRCKLKTALSAPSSPVANGGLKCNGLSQSLFLPSPPPPPPSPPPPPPLIEDTSYKEVPLSESSSCSSSTHSEESCISQGLPLSSAPGKCNGHAPPPPLHSKRSMKRQRSRQAELQFTSTQVVGAAVNSLPSLQQLIKGNKKLHVGTIGAIGDM
ncbi:hypothetical protein DPEC_G00341180 [Dallia pectoralis]|uniref:Uncharacterized protein n=1 Tax=Dallia pectoralis TaxID=75939 RepID=A0ACC2F5D6_DALPE|nr:hypothetical protein DPEC_G00341180 [Dallia pectoralis]